MHRTRNEYAALKSSAFPSRVLKYIKGPTPCGNCNSNSHKSCRPRLDGTMCSCACPRSQSHRDVYEQTLEIARSNGEPVPTVLEAMSFILPRVTRRISKCGIHTHLVLDKKPVCG